MIRDEGRNRCLASNSPSGFAFGSFRTLSLDNTPTLTRSSPAGMAGQRTSGSEHRAWVSHSGLVCARW